MASMQLPRRSRLQGASATARIKQKNLPVSYPLERGLADPTDVRSSMPRYFFNTRIGTELMLDPEGEELRDPDQAWNVARRTIREILKTEGGPAGLLNAILEVTDDEGEIVLEFPFTEAILDGSEDSG